MSNCLSFLLEREHRRSMRQSELLGLMVEKRGSNEIAEDTADEKRPVGIKQILDKNIKPNKEEYVE